MGKINLDALRSIPDASASERAGITNRLATQQPAFVSKPDYLAVFAFGGTIQSAYVPADENIVPVPMNTGLDRTLELASRFGVANKKMTGALLSIKDSRNLEDADFIQLIYTIKEVPNKRICVTCGTYKLPIVSQALDMHFGHGKSDKIIGVTGSWLPAPIEGQDVDFNIGGTIAAMNAFDVAGSKGLVFAQFHGEIFTGPALEKLELHLPEINPRYARPLVDML